MTDQNAPTTLRVFIANNITAINWRDKTHFSLKMTTVRAVETSVTLNNSPIHAGLRSPGRSYSAYLWNNDNNNNNNNSNMLVLACTKAIFIL